MVCELRRCDIAVIGRGIAGVSVAAAGARADQAGATACAAKIGPVSKRSLALIVTALPGIEIGPIPLTVNAEDEFILGPDTGKLLISPANEDPDVPSDVQPDEMDIAHCFDRIGRDFCPQVVSTARMQRSPEPQPGEARA